MAAPIRYDMDKNHTFDFVEGVRECAIDPGMLSSNAANNKFFTDR